MHRDAGDHGDQDLEMALKLVQNEGRKVALVTFGHMHSELYSLRHALYAGGPQHRNMIAIDADTGQS